MQDECSSTDLYGSEDLVAFTWMSLLYWELTFMTSKLVTMTNVNIIEKTPFWGKIMVFSVPLTQHTKHWHSIQIPSNLWFWNEICKMEVSGKLWSLFQKWYSQSLLINEKKVKSQSLGQLHMLVQQNKSPVRVAKGMIQLFLPSVIPIVQERLNYISSPSLEIARTGPQQRNSRVRGSNFILWVLF
jgi:hypothetical protein